MSTGIIIKKLVSTVNAAKPVAPYTQAVVADRTVYVSGCLGLECSTNVMVPGGADKQMVQALKNLEATLQAAGSSIQNVVKTTVFVQDLNDFAKVNEEYKKVFEGNFPARSCVQVAKLPFNGLVEIEAVALTGEVKVICT